MKRNLIVASVALAVVVATAGAMAQGRGKGPGPQQGKQQIACAQALGLTQAQTDEIAKMRTAFWNDTSALRADCQAVCSEIKTLGPNPDPKQLDEKNRELAAIRAEMQKRYAAFQQSVMNILTPEQKAKCQKMQQSGKNGMGCGLGACILGGAGGPGMGACPAGKAMGPGCGMGPGACGKGAGYGKGQGQGGGPNRK